MRYYEKFDLKPEEIIIYLRKSRSDDPLLSVEEVLAKHEKILSEWVDKNIHARMQDAHIFREVVSGETIDDRPEMLKLLRLIESPQIKAVLVVEVQRLSRGDLEDAGRLIKILRYTNTIVITPQISYDLQDDYDRDNFERELKRGNEFLEYQKKIMNRGTLLSVSQGNFVGSLAPYGYDKAFVMDGRRKCPTLSINEQEAAVVRMVYDLYVNQDMGTTNIAHHLNQLHIKPRKNEFWTKSSIEPMLRNIHYTGKVRWNERKTQKVVEAGEIRKSRPRSSDILIFDGKHEAIISEELFAEAQKKHGMHARQRYNFELRNPLAGIFYCSCGHAMTMRPYGSRCENRYLCQAQQYCGSGSSRCIDIDSRITSILEDAIADFDIKIKQSSADAYKTHEKHIEDLKHQLKLLEQKELHQWEKYSEDGMPKDIFERLNEKVLVEKENVRRAIAYAYDTMPDSPTDYEERKMTFEKALASYHDDSISVAEKNVLLKSCIERITYTRQRQQRITGTKRDGFNGWAQSALSLEVKLKL